LDIVVCASIDSRNANSPLAWPNRSGFDTCSSNAQPRAYIQNNRLLWLRTKTHKPNAPHQKGARRCIWKKRFFKKNKKKRKKKKKNFHGLPPPSEDMKRPPQGQSFKSKRLGAPPLRYLRLQGPGQKKKEKKEKKEKKTNLASHFSWT
jgi:hypothetical protein